jgi:hypothetical protein
MRRRDFITVLVGAAAWMPAARAQEPQRVIGFLTGTRSPDIRLPFVPSFLQGLKDSGFVEVETSRSNTASQKITIACDHWRPNW